MPGPTQSVKESIRIRIEQAEQIKREFLRQTGPRLTKIYSDSVQLQASLSACYNELDARRQCFKTDPSSWLNSANIISLSKDVIDICGRIQKICDDIDLLLNEIIVAQERIRAVASDPILTVRLTQGLASAHSKLVAIQHDLRASSEVAIKNPNGSKLLSAIAERANTDETFKVKLEERLKDYDLKEWFQSTTAAESPSPMIMVR